MTVQNTSPLTHFDADGQAHMVDVGTKAETRRVAVATGRIVMLPDTFAMVKSGSAKKGDVLGTRLSKLPPVALAIVVLTVLPLT